MSLINSATKRSKSRSNTPTAARNLGSDTICRASELPAGATVCARAAPTVNVASNATIQNPAERKRMNALRVERVMNDESSTAPLSQAHETESRPLAARARPSRSGSARRYRLSPTPVAAARGHTTNGRPAALVITTAPARFTWASTCAPGSAASASPPAGRKFPHLHISALSPSSATSPHAPMGCHVVLNSNVSRTA